MPTESAPSHITEISLADNETLLPSLVSCWRASVEATHTFLTQADIERIARYVPDVIKSIAHFAVCFKEGDNDEFGEGSHNVIGFIGAEGDQVEMLFIDPAFRGQGIGTKLLDYAIQTYHPTLVDVNEQNEQAIGFYLHYGFHTIGRSETDDAGDPFPILHMQLN